MKRTAFKPVKQQTWNVSSKKDNCGVYKKEEKR